MSMIPMYKICSKCKRKYLWNMDVGKISCPYCGYINILGAGDIPHSRKGDFNKKVM